MSTVASDQPLSARGTEQPSEDLVAVSEITELASRTTVRGDLLTFALDRFLRLTGMEMGGVLLLEGSGEFALRVQRGLPEGVLRQLQDGLSLEWSLPAYSVRECRLMVLQDAAGDPRELPVWRELG